MAIPVPNNDERRVRDEFLAFMRATEHEIPHVQHVAWLALRLFDELRPLHGLGARERLWLEAAACLHDIGWTVAEDGTKHHKHSARLIREHPWRTLSRPEIEIVAQVARYHRKSMPNAEHEDFVALAPPQRRMIENLAAILRVADGLDRSHRQRITNLRVVISSGQVAVSLRAMDSIKPELLAARKKSDLANQVLGREMIFEEA